MEFAVHSDGVAPAEGPDAPACAVSGWASLEAMLQGRDIMSPDAMARALVVQRGSGERLDSVLTRLGLLSEQALAEHAAAATALPILAADGFPSAPVPGPALSAAFLHDRRCVPVALDMAAITVAVSDPYDAFVGEALAFMYGRPVRRMVARASDIDTAIERLYGTERPQQEMLAESDDDDLERLKDLVSDAPAIRAVNRMIANAVDERASDIHVEPSDDCLAIRFRVDGVLRDMPTLPASMRNPIVSRIKIMAALNIAERRLPQDGRMRVAVRGHEIDLRVATAPSIHGESVVMRILDRSKLALDFGSLGFDEDLTGRLRAAIHRPHGIVLVTGPTGSGKTTTLYAALAELNAPERKLLTVEDPIEYRLAGVIQTQVNPAIGFTFGAALRSFLRQDPDIIMVGEIRDGETAQIAVQAALTGHLILSTLHTNTAAGAITRLADIGVEPFLLSSVLNGVLAQRLVRRLCTACREPYTPDETVAAAIDPVGGETLPATFFRARGCDRCSQTGYTGRIALHEFLDVDDRMARLILERADARQISAAAAESGMRSLVSDGFAKAAAGLTTIEEILRVASED